MYVLMGILVAKVEILASIWYNSMFEQKYTQCHFKHFSFYRHTKPLKGMHFGQFSHLKYSMDDKYVWINRCISKNIPW